MEKQMELELLRKYVETRSVYEQIYTLSLLMGEIVQADCTLPYYTDEIRLLMAAISPEAARIEPLLSEMETDLFHEMEKLEQILHIPLEKSAMCVGLSMMCYTLGKEKRTFLGDFQLRGLIGKLLYCRCLTASCFSKSAKQ